MNNSKKNKLNIDLNNPEMQDAIRIIQNTHQTLFLTGKAGTGKSTFLRYIAQTTKKKYIVLAPTGIAAINAGGSTLHSFFKLPFHPLLPNDTRYTQRKLKDTLKYNGEKRKILREVELIIIDEISMVRADIIDFIDKVLRVYSRNIYQPFGGKQLLLVGDMYQLEPVLKEDERQLLKPYYPSTFFFDALVFKEMKLVSIELQKVYRQTDPTFINILDSIRTTSVSIDQLSTLNKQVGKAIANDKNKLAITLSGKRDTVDHINEQELSRLPGKPITLYGHIEGDFPESNLPTPIELYLKVGAQVLFIKNDKEKRWVNGTLGTIVSFSKEEPTIIVVRTEKGEEVNVEQEIWSNVIYSYNEKEQKIEEQEIGVYQQYPLKLAWAITIHKSQGLTFNNVNIDLTGGVFAGGQTYVALSRCTSLEGISLKYPIRKEDVFIRSEIVQFAQRYNNQDLIKQVLEESKADREYQQAVLAFNKGDMEEALSHFFIAIHQRYDIEKPLQKRFIQYKLNEISKLKRENKRIKDELNQHNRFLKELAVEYTMMGRECEKEHFFEAAIKNYEKALKLCPDYPEPRKRIEKLNKSTQK
ncbi:AAA family ATPase [Prevotella nanceiensis]|nr:AAA family ATPase [Hoylesella nanceiensis]MBW4833753.1 AAA family ATPase [Hoylesella nanceiensis]